jgi:predicted O-methyltransferase YrrM
MPISCYDDPRMSKHEQFLDAAPPLLADVGYGTLGSNGDLGYEDQRVQVGGQSWPHALSAHAPSRLVFPLPVGGSEFHSQVALNDDVAGQRTSADFLVYADDRLVAVVPDVQAGEAAAQCRANVAGARRLQLVVETKRFEHCHAVWLDPRVSIGRDSAERTLIDCLRRVEIELPQRPLRSKRCIATVASPGFESWLNDMLGSLRANSGCIDALVVVFAVNADAAIEEVAAKYGAQIVRCRAISPLKAAIKALLYSAARVIDADEFVCLDADMLVLGDLRPLFAAIEACPGQTVFACREGNGTGWHTFKDLRHAITTVYGGRAIDLTHTLGAAPHLGEYALVVNDGLFAGSRRALLALDGAIRRIPGATGWVDEKPQITWRNQFIFNLALAKLDCGVELETTYNVQLYSQDVHTVVDRGRLQANWKGSRAKVLHFCGPSRHKCPEFRQVFARVSDPLFGDGGGNGYGEFLAALRSWIGRHGRKALAWSFYGTVDGSSGRVHDPSTFPHLAALHYLIRSNGCVRILETGTARGVSTACLASAVAHRAGGRVVTLDPWVSAEREDLWESLPPAMRKCIEPRQVDSLTGMASALRAGERFEAALLDSVHTAEHVWKEFQLASQLVCPGGLILIHDVTLPGATVDTAVQRIAAEGYGVARLWTAEGGVAEDNQFGLAVVENRRRPPPRTSERPGELVARAAAPPLTRQESAGTPLPANASDVPTSPPLVSCVMPTRDRPALVLQALRYFERQTYPSRELIVLDDGDGSLREMLPDSDRIRYLHMSPGRSIGDKRNLGCSAARGEIVVHWDDDDWYAPTRLAEQVAPLLSADAEMSGLTGTVFFDLLHWRFLTCTPAIHRQMFVENVHGATLAFRREVWQRMARYPDISLAEDAAFLRRAIRQGARLHPVENRQLFVYLRHGTNSWRFRCGEYLDAQQWREVDKELMPREDLDFYAHLLSQRRTANSPSGPAARLLMSSRAAGAARG